MQPIPLPAPYSGVDERTPVIALQSPFCESILNFNVTQEGVQLRNGDSKYATFNITLPATLYGFAQYGDTRLLVIQYNGATNGIDLHDIDAGTVVFSSAALGLGGYFTKLFFNGRLFIFNDLAYAPGFYHDGAAYGVIGYTGTSFLPIAGDVYKNRAYIIQSGEAAYWYTGIGQVTGALDATNDAGKVDLSSIVSQKCSLSSIAPFTLADTVSAVTLQAFIFSNGEILFYNGSYPNSADWGLVGTARIAQPLFYKSYIPYQGDSLILCDGGIVSLRDLFLKGSQQAASLSVNDNVQKTWAALVLALRASLSAPVGPLSAGQINGVWDPKTNRIIISFPVFIDSAGSLRVGNFQFVFNCELQSWGFHRSMGANLLTSTSDITIYKNKTLLLAQGLSKVMVSEKEGSSSFTDRDVDDAADTGYDYEIISAPVSQGRAYVQRGAGLDVILETDLYAETNYQFIQDFGVATTTAQTLPTGPTTLQKPFVNMGIEGSYIQYKISGTTTTGKTVGYNLYGVNFWVDAGDSPR